MIEHHARIKNTGVWNGVIKCAILILDFWCVRCSIRVNRGLKSSTLLRVRLYSSAMEESNLSKLNVLPQPQTDRFLPLPLELMLVIIQLLSHKDQQTFCLLSQSSRQLALSAVFRKLVYSRNVGFHIKRFNEARGDVKAAIKFVRYSYQPLCYDTDPWLLVHLPWIRELALHDLGYGDWDHESILFPFLRTLPNLQSFTFSQFHRSPGSLQLVASLQHCPLEHFTYWVPLPFFPEEPVTAPPRLKSLSVNLCVFKSRTQQDSVMLIGSCY